MAFHYFPKLFPLLLPQIDKKKKKLEAFPIIKQHTVYSEMNYVLKYVYYVQTMMQVYRAW